MRAFLPRHDCARAECHVTRRTYVCVVDNILLPSLLAEEPFEAELKSHHALVCVCDSFIYSYKYVCADVCMCV